MQQQKLCLKWNNHTINLLSVLETFQSKDILVDVTLSCEGRNIKAHKMVLSACSPYFQNIFLENPCQHPIVIINGMKFEDITAILNFMYKGEVNVSHEGLSSFLQAAEALKVKGLAEVCGEKKGSNSNSIETEPIEQSRPQRIDTPNKKRHRNRKRSFSDSNRSDDEGAPRKIKEVNSPEVHELSGDESFTGDMSSNGQQLNSLTPRNVYSRSHQSSSNITTEDMDDEYEVEPSKMLEQTLTENANNSTSSDNGLRIERIVGNASEMESSSLQEPESPPDIKPIIEYGESSTVPLDGNMMVYNEQSQPGPSNIQDGSLLHDNSHTQVGNMFRFSNVINTSEKSKQKSSCETVQLLKDLKDDPMCTCHSNHTVFFKEPVVVLNDVNGTKENENIRCLNRSKQLFIINEKGFMRGIEMNREMVPKEESDIFEYKSTFEPSEKNALPGYNLPYDNVDDHSSFSKNSLHDFSSNFSCLQIPNYNNDGISSDMDSREEVNLSMIPQSHPHYTVTRTLHKKTYTGKKRGRKPKSLGLKKQASKMYSDTNNHGDERTIPCTLLENHSFTQVSVEEVHLAANNAVSRPRRNIQKKSASEMLMLKRKIRKKIVQSTIKYQSSKFDKKCTVKMDTKFSDNNRDIKQKKNTKTNTGKSSVKKNVKTNIERSLVKRNIQNSCQILEKYGPELLPPGWTQQLVKRKTGKSAGIIDIYFVTPEGRRLRSRVEVASYIEQNNLPYLPEEFCFRKSAYKNAS